MRRRAAAASVFTLLIAGCGTRLPDSAFSSVPTASPSAAVVNGNFASDVGVTATTIQVGVLNSKTNPFDPDAFAPMYYGVQAYFRYLDDHGGVHGRMVQLHLCDDQGQGSGNVDCVHTLIASDHVFAFAGNAVLQYSGAPDVQRAGVPDIGGQPVDVAYDTYRDMYSLYGSLYPRDNRTPGWNGYDYGGTEVYRYFRLRFPATPRVAAVVYYNQAASQRFATSIIAGLRAEGYRTYGEQVDFALPDFNSVVLDMKRRHVRYVYDTLDSGGNQGLCAAIDQNQMPIQAKVTTEESWRDDIGRTYQQSTRCRAALFAYGYADNYDDLSNPAVAQFRAAVHSYHLDARNRLSEWELDGWAAAQWLTDAMQSCGAALTRRCVLHFMDAIPAGGYDGHGLLSPVGTYFPRLPNPPKTARTCVGVARWEDSAIAGQGGWVTQPVVGNRPDRGFSCFVVPLLPYPAT